MPLKKDVALGPSSRLESLSPFSGRVSKTNLRRTERGPEPCWSTQMSRQVAAPRRSTTVENIRVIIGINRLFLVMAEGRSRSEFCSFCQLTEPILNCSRCELPGCNLCICDSSLVSLKSVQSGLLIICKLCRGEQVWLLRQTKDSSPQWLKDIPLGGSEEHFKLTLEKEISLECQGELERTAALIQKSIKHPHYAFRQLELNLYKGSNKAYSLRRVVHFLLAQNTIMKVEQGLIQLLSFLLNYLEEHQAAFLGQTILQLLQPVNAVWLQSVTSTIMEAARKSVGTEVDLAPLEAFLGSSLKSFIFSLYVEVVPPKRLTQLFATLFRSQQNFCNILQNKSVKLLSSIGTTPSKFLFEIRKKASVNQPEIKRGRSLSQSQNVLPHNEAFLEGMLKKMITINKLVGSIDCQELQGTISEQKSRIQELEQKVRGLESREESSYGISPRSKECGSKESELQFYKMMCEQFKRKQEKLFTLLQEKDSQLEAVYKMQQQISAALKESTSLREIVQQLAPLGSYGLHLATIIRQWELQKSGPKESNCVLY